MIELNVTNFITIGLCAMAFFALYNAAKAKFYQSKPAAQA